MGGMIETRGEKVMGVCLMVNLPTKLSSKSVDCFGVKLINLCLGV